MSAASISVPTSSPTLSKRRKRRKRKKDPSRPKKPQSAFLLFAADTRASIRTNYPQDSLPERSKRLGELWRGLSASDKRPYEERADQLKVAYTKELTEWKSKQPPKVKRARSAYAFFMRDVRSALAAKSPDKNPRELMSDVALAWKQADATTIAKYKQMAEEDKQRFQRENNS